MTPARVAAFFDLDGTLTRTDVFREHLAFRRACDDGPRHLAWQLGVPLRAIGALALDRVSRELLNRWVHSWVAGRPPEQLARWAAEHQARHGLSRSPPRALELLERHAALGHRLVILTGALEPLAAAHARQLETALSLPGIRVEANVPTVRDGRLDGGLEPPVLIGRAKAQRAAGVAREEGLDLEASYAYSDGASDAPLLELVGRPAAVRPDRRLRRLARRRGWPVLELEGTRR